MTNETTMTTILYLVGWHSPVGAATHSGLATEAEAEAMLQAGIERGNEPRDFIKRLEGKFSRPDLAKDLFPSYLQGGLEYEEFADIAGLVGE